MTRWRTVAAIAVCFAAAAGCDSTSTRPDPPPPTVASQPTREASFPQSTTAPLTPTGPKPPVVLISLDTVRADHLGCYGYPRGTTPHLDRFAESAVRFAECRTQAVWTLPSHMSVFTSMLPSDHGVDDLHKTLPADRITLAETLQEAGYRTAALVNDGQMKAHWGFDRGFDEWREFPVDTPAGDCEHITDAAIAWLRSQPDGAPAFLFLHYYDAHDPYAAPEEFRKRFGTTLTGDEARELAFRHRTPERNIDDSSILADLVAAYDADLAWLDHELGRLFAAIPDDALVVVFSDHGEAFEEHGWTLHGAALYEEDVRVPLIVRLPRSTGAASRGAVSTDPVMLLDIAPTICRAAGVPVPAQFGGMDLAPAWSGGKIAQRLIPAETKAFLEGRWSQSITVGSWKGIHSPVDGRWELYRLPDETTNVAEKEPAVLDALIPAMRAWVERNEFWTIHAVGEGDYELTIRSLDGAIGTYIPIGLDPERDDVEISRDRRTLKWHVYPKGDRPKALCVEAVASPGRLVLDATINGRLALGSVFAGPESEAVEALPATLSKAIDPSPAYREAPFAAPRAGFHVLRNAAGQSQPARGDVRPLDEETLRKLRSLGYVR